MSVAYAMYWLASAAVPTNANEAVPATNPARWIQLQDWPRAIDFDRGRGPDWTVRFKLTVAGTGRVTRCQIINASGSSEIDYATCRALLNRARFKPHADQSRYFVRKYRWSLLR
jgi:TonB family protein